MLLPFWLTAGCCCCGRVFQRTSRAIFHVADLLAKPGERIAEAEGAAFTFVPVVANALAILPAALVPAGFVTACLRCVCCLAILLLTATADTITSAPRRASLCFSNGLFSGMGAGRGMACNGTSPLRITNRALERDRDIEVMTY